VSIVCYIGFFFVHILIYIFVSNIKVCKMPFIKSKVHLCMGTEALYRPYDP